MKHEPRPGKRRMRASRNAATSPPPGRFYGALDSWRGVCACLVALYHFRAPGSLGVLTNSHLTDNRLIASAYLFTDFFFVLSGFVIAANYRDRLSRGGGMRRFLALRLARVWPLHAATLLLVAAVLLVAQFAMQARLGASVSPFVGIDGPFAFATNALMVHAWHLHPYTTWNRPSWSISAEVTVYALFALAMRWTAGLRRVAAVAVLVGAPAFLLWKLGQWEGTYDWGVPRALFGFVLGAVVYAATERFPTTGWLRPGTVASVAETGLLSACGVLVATQGGTPGSMLVPFLFAVTVYVFAFERGAVSALFVRAPLRAVGRWSYSIYLLHYPLQLGFVLGTAFLPPFILDGLVTTQRLANGRVVQVLGVTRWQGDLAAITMLVALVSLSAIAYRLVESPPRRWMRVRLGNV